MNKFGIIKSKMLTKLSESYANENKAEIKDILTTIKENKDFKEMYLFYEEIESKTISDKETAKLYVDGLNAYFSEPIGNWNNLNMFCKSLDSKLGDIKISKNELYESLDMLFEKNSLSNIENKIIAKKILIEHLISKKEILESNEVTLVPNETLLNAVLANNFNVLYSNTLSESQKEELKGILSISYDELIIKSNELQESIITEISKLLIESNDSDLTIKLNSVKDEVTKMSPSRYNYYRLNELKNGLN